MPWLRDIRCTGFRVADLINCISDCRVFAIHATDLKTATMRCLCRFLCIPLALLFKLDAKADSLRVACLGDSITAGARVDPQTQSYPAQLQEILGYNFDVRNFGVAGATLIQTGKPRVWQIIDKVKEFSPHIVIISLGTNDTVGGSRKNWENINRFDRDYQELINWLAKLPTQPRIIVCTPTTMVLETSAMKPARLENLKERKPRLQELCKQIRVLTGRNHEKKVSLLELNPVLSGRPDLVTRGDGVHPNAAGYRAIARVVAVHVRRELKERPNIIFVMADDMGYGDAGCFGGKLIKTSNINRLAAEGMRFTQCYAGSTVCAPSRSVLMTGLHTGHTRVRGNFGKGGVKGLGGGNGRIPLHAGDVTVAEVLKRAGYATGITGKWGLGEPSTQGTPNRQGFDQWLGYLNQRRAHMYYPSFIWLNSHRFDLPGNANEQRQQYTHDLFTGFALNFIRNNHDRPFFLYLPYTVPHARFEIPDLGPYENREWPENAKVYAAMITRMDQHIGQMMTLLKELKIDKNTIVFFCSDNGAAKRHDGLFDSSGPLRGQKRDMYEGGLRTPMIARWPGHIPANSTSETVWSFADFLPTAASLAQISKPDNLDGISVVPTLLGQTQDFSERFLYWEFFEKGFQQAARWRNWKVIRPAVGAPLELYNLATDTGEKNNVALQQSGIIAKFEAYLKTARTQSLEWPLEDK